MLLKLKCPDGSEIQVSTALALHSSQHGVSIEGQPTDLVFLAPVAGHQAVELRVTGNAVEILVERWDESCSGWAIVDHLVRNESTLLSTCCRSRFSVTAPPAAAPAAAPLDDGPSNTFLVLPVAAAPNLQQLAHVATSMLQPPPAASSAPPISAAALSQSAVRANAPIATATPVATAAPAPAWSCVGEADDVLLRPRLNEEKLAEMGFSSLAEAQAVLGEDFFGGPLQATYAASNHSIEAQPGDDSAESMPDYAATVPPMHANIVQPTFHHPPPDVPVPPAHPAALSGADWRVRSGPSKRARHDAIDDAASGAPAADVSILGTVDGTSAVPTVVATGGVSAMCESSVQGVCASAAGQAAWPYRSQFGEPDACESTAGPFAGGAAEAAPAGGGPAGGAVAAPAGGGPRCLAARAVDGGRALAGSGGEATRAAVTRDSAVCAGALRCAASAADASAAGPRADAVGAAPADSPAAGRVGMDATDSAAGEGCSGVPGQQAVEPVEAPSSAAGAGAAVEGLSERPERARDACKAEATTAEAAASCSAVKQEANQRESEEGDLEAPFALLWLRYNLGAPFNHGCFGVKLRQLVCGPMQLAVVSNYMVDFAWLLSACPDLAAVQHLVLVHGQQQAATQNAVSECMEGTAAKVTVWKPPLPIAYGTHHSKFFLLTYPTGLRLVVHTANLIFCDCNNKTQGLWFQDFPLKASTGVGVAAGSDFEESLLDYLRALALPRAAAARVASVVAAHDFSAARAALVPSTPGRHTGVAISRLGHMRVRALLAQELLPAAFRAGDLALQFSSVGSLTEKWLLHEFARSLRAGRLEADASGSAADAAPHSSLAAGGGPQGADYGDDTDHARVHLVWPTVEDVRESFEGWAAGGSIPGFPHNVKKPFLQGHWSRWSSAFCRRRRAMPHIKSYCRFNGPDVAWFLLASHNLSKAAWGELEKGGSQLFMRSYELGVLLLPSLEARFRSHPLRAFSCTTALPQQGPHRSPLLRCPRNAVPCAPRCPGPDDATGPSADAAASGRCQRVVFKAAWQGEGAPVAGGVAVVPLPVPYELPPPLYDTGDEPWVVDVAHAGLDSTGKPIEHAGLPMHGFSQQLVPPYFEENN